MRALRGLLAVAVVVAYSQFSSEPAKALGFDWSISGVGVSGAGTFDASLVSGVTYDLTSIAGSLTVDSVPYTITGLSGYAGADNKIFYPGANSVSFAGISFASTGGMTWNIFTDGGAIHYGLLESFLNPVGFPDPHFDISFAIAQTPLPAALMLFLSGLGLLGWLGRRQRQQSMAFAT